MNVTRLFTRNLTVEALISVRSATVRAHRDFADLGANVVRLSNALERLGVCVGDRVLILCGSRIESVESLLATMHLGAVAVQMNVLAGKANLLSTVESVAPRCCIFEETPEPALRNALEARGTIMIAVRRPDAASPSTWIHYDRLLAPSDLSDHGGWLKWRERRRDQE